MCVYVCVMTVKEKHFHHGTSYEECNVLKRTYYLAFSGTGRTGHLQHDFYHRRNFILPLVGFLRFSMLQRIYFCSISLQLHIAKAVKFAAYSFMFFWFHSLSMCIWLCFVCVCLMLHIVYFYGYFYVFHFYVYVFLLLCMWGARWRSG